MSADRSHAHEEARAHGKRAATAEAPDAATGSRDTALDAEEQRREMLAAKLAEIHDAGSTDSEHAEKMALLKEKQRQLLREYSPQPRERRDKPASRTDILTAKLAKIRDAELKVVDHLAKADAEAACGSECERTEAEAAGAEQVAEQVALLKEKQRQLHDMSAKIRELLDRVRDEAAQCQLRLDKDGVDSVAAGAGSVDSAAAVARPE